MSRATAAAAPHAGEPLNLWQVPAFFLGVAALADVALLRPHWRTDPAALFDRDLNALQLATDPAAPDLSAAAVLTRRVEPNADRWPDKAGRAYLLLGTAQSLLAESLAGAEAAEAWWDARRSLEAADRHGLPDGGRPRWAYRLGKTIHKTGGEPDRAAALLAEGAEAADDPAEGYALSAQAYLKLPTPDVPKALEATRQQLARTRPGTDGRAAAAARLTLAGLHFQQRQADEARKVLEGVDASAPADLLAEARVRLAQSFADEQDWESAARHAEQAVRVTEQATPDAPTLGALRYQLGVYYARAQRWRDAGETWEKARNAGGAEGQAATLRLAGLRLQSENRAAAVELLDAALGTVRAPGDWRNPLVPLAELQQLFEAAVQTYQAGGEFATAGRAAKLFGRVSGPARDRELTAQSAEQWAKSLQVRAEQTPPGGRGPLEAEAKQHFTEAADEYLALADQFQTAGALGEWLRHAADCLLAAGERTRALAALGRLTGSGLPAEARTEAWFQIGELRSAAGDRAGAKEAFRSSRERAGRYTGRARLELALLKAADKQFADAVADLEKNLEPPHDGDPATLERTLSALGDCCVGLKDYAKARSVFERLLQQFPAGTAAGEAYYQLGLCFYHLAQKESAGMRTILAARRVRSAGGTPAPAEPDEESRWAEHQRRYAEHLGGMGENCKKAETALLDKQARLSRQDPPARLSPDEERRLWQMSLCVANAQFFSGEFEAAAQSYNALALRYQRQVNELIALAQVSHCHYKLNQPDRVRAAVERVRAALDQLPDSAFDGTEEVRQRAYWDNWLREASTPQAPQPAPAKP